MVELEIETREKLNKEDLPEAIKELLENNILVKEKMEELLNYHRYSYEHSENVAKIIVKFFESDTNILSIDLDEEEKKELIQAAFLHDIGKLGISLEILNNTSPKLSPKQREIMNQHSIYTFNTLVGLKCENLAELAVSHHEFPLKGQSSYPEDIDSRKGLTKKDKIMRELIALADEVDAMRGERSYHSGMTDQQVMEMLTEGKKTFLEQDELKNLVKSFLEIRKNLIHEQATT